MNGERGRQEKECGRLRIVLLLGEDDAIEGAAAWSLRRAAELGGDFELWHTNERDPFGDRVRAMDASGGEQREWEEYHREPSRGEDRYGDLLSDYTERCVLIEELVIVHHGGSVEEDEVLAGLFEILVLEKRIPVCKLVYWACNAAVDLDVSTGHWVDILMRAMGGLSRGQPECVCHELVELIWPTAGRCHLDPFDGDRLETNDGDVNRMRWGYRHGDGQLNPSPDPDDSHPMRNPPNRERAQVRGSVLGMDVGRH